MEKQSDIKRNRFVIGLLILITTFTLNAAPRISPSQIRQLKISPVPNQILEAGRDIKYELIIPETEPSSVEITNPQSVDTIIFKTLRRTQDNFDGTRIEIWYEFTKGGEQSPAPLVVKIGRNTYRIPFVPCELKENPANLKPCMTIAFKNGNRISTDGRDIQSPLFSSTVSSRLRFTVYVQYTKNVIKFDYDIPKDGLLDNLRTYEIAEAKYRETSYSHDLIPVADFEWIPLKSGNISLPQIRMTVIQYDGLQTKLSTPDCFIKVTPSKNGNVTASGTDRFFKDSFAEEENLSVSGTSSDNGNDIFKRIDIRRKRLQITFYISLAVLVLALLLVSLLKIKSPFPYTILALLMLLVLIFFTVLSKKKTAVYTSGTVSSIPEKNVGKQVQIPENSEVRIIKETAYWYCIQNGGITGWTQKENITRY